MSAVHNSSHTRKSFRIVMATALALLPLAAMNDALACAACGCTLSKDWGAQGIMHDPRLFCRSVLRLHQPGPATLRFRQCLPNVDRPSMAGCTGDRGLHRHADDHGIAQLHQRYLGSRHAASIRSADAWHFWRQWRRRFSFPRLLQLLVVIRQRYRRHSCHWKIHRLLRRQDHRNHSRNQVADRKHSSKFQLGCRSRHPAGFAACRSAPARPTLFWEGLLPAP